MTHTISGFDVEFPHQPYNVQLQFMAKMLEALEQGTNALLEAPTGSGKTLSLLCSSLAWQTRHHKRMAEEAAAQHALGATCWSNHNSVLTRHSRCQRRPSRATRQAKARPKDLLCHAHALANRPSRPGAQALGLHAAHDHPGATTKHLCVYTT